MRFAWLWPAIITLSALAVAFVSILDTTSPFRLWIALWFLLVCPGMSLVRLLHLKDGLAEMTLAIALSIALDTIVSSVFLYAGLWSPKTKLLVLILISLCGVALQILTQLRGLRGVDSSLQEDTIGQ